MRDVFTEQFIVRRGLERLNRGGWRVLGSLAASALLTVGASGKSDKGAVRLAFAGNEEWNLAAFNGGSVSADVMTDPLVTKALRQLRKVEGVVAALAVTDGRPSEAKIPIKPYVSVVRSAVRWRGIGKAKTRLLGMIAEVFGLEVFDVTPAGAVLLSALYGIARGHVVVCQNHDCRELIVRREPRGFVPKRCWFCSNRGRETPPADLPVRNVKIWKKALARMSRRGFKRLTYDDERQIMLEELAPRRGSAPRQRAAWRRDAKLALVKVRTAKEEEEWEQNFAPRGRPGRPRASAKPRGTRGMRERRAS